MLPFLWPGRGRLSSSVTLAARSLLPKVCFRSWTRIEENPFGAGRRLMPAAGHRVVAVHPRYVRAYRRRSKTDRNDCDAILEAARCEGIRPVPVKSAPRQQVQQLHALREAWKKSRVQRINLLRGILCELGVPAPGGPQAFLRQACELIERPEVRALRGALQVVLGETSLYEQSIRECEEQLGGLACRGRDRAQARRGQPYRPAHRQRPEGGGGHA